MIDSIKRKIALGILNGIFSGPHFFGIKHHLISFAGVCIGQNSKVVGPLRIGGGASLHIGENVWLGRNFSIEGDGEVSLLDNIDVGPNVTIGTGGHLVGPSNRRAGEGIVTSCTIENGCWICQNSIIINDCIIGSGSIVAAGSVVVSSVEANSLVAGVPAKLKKSLQ